MNTETADPAQPVQLRKQAPFATRDQRLQAQTLRAADFTYAQIREQTGLTLHQVQYAITHPLTPQKREARPFVLSEAEVEQIIDWIYASRRNRRTS